MWATAGQHWPKCNCLFIRRRAAFKKNYKNLILSEVAVLVTVPQPRKTAFKTNANTQKSKRCDFCCTYRKQSDPTSSVRMAVSQPCCKSSDPCLILYLTPTDSKIKYHRNIFIHKTNSRYSIKRSAKKKPQSIYHFQGFIESEIF